MKRVVEVAAILIAITFVTGLIGCSKSSMPEAAVKSSDGSEDLKISYRLNVAQADTENFFSFSGNVRYLAAEKDQADEVSGASKLRSKQVFHAYLYDVEGKKTMSGGLRGLFLFATNPYRQIEIDNLNASKAADGVITIQYVHRGTAYRIKTDTSGRLSFPDGSFEKRTIGYIEGGGPQVLSMDFSTDASAATVDWNKVWDSKIASGMVIEEGVDKKTGDIVPDIADATSMYYFDGTLGVSFENDILGIDGFLTAVPR